MISFFVSHAEGFLVMSLCTVAVSLLKAAALTWAKKGDGAEDSVKSTLG